MIWQTFFSGLGSPGRGSTRSSCRSTVPIPAAACRGGPQAWRGACAARVYLAAIGAGIPPPAAQGGPAAHTRLATPPAPTAPSAPGYSDRYARRQSDTRPSPGSATRPTWSQTLLRHPPRRGLVTGGGLSDAGHWVAVRHGVLLPRRVVGGLPGPAAGVPPPAETGWEPVACGGAPPGEAGGGQGWPAGGRRRPFGSPIAPMRRRPLPLWVPTAPGAGDLRHHRERPWGRAGLHAPSREGASLRTRGAGRPTRCGSGPRRARGAPVELTGGRLTPNR